VDRPVSDDPESGGVMSGQHPSFGSGGSRGHRNISFDNRPTVAGAAGYDYGSRHSSFASVHSNSSRKNSIAEVGVRIQFG
jgi:hypothetical protein